MQSFIQPISNNPYLHAMTQPYDNNNHFFRLASQLVSNTSRHIFLTGRAGTGKTTFLRYIQQTTQKNCAVVAPTGVAAINAGGVTMHSLFHLPFAPFIPEGSSVSHFNTSSILVEDRHSLFRKARFNKEKKEVIQKLELLIIDEVSMLRCDMLDAVDTIMRAFRSNHNEPFGGVQVLYIGDMFQLPPVVKNDEWAVLKNYYEGPFFFNSKVVQQSPPLYIELQKIYRQNEQQFIDLLNRVRNSTMDDSDFEILNNKYQPSFKPNKEEKYIVLSTHNYKADEINNNELTRLPSPIKILKGIIEGDFPDHLLPTEKDLSLKEGAQVMFIKNDSGESRKYFNGKIVTVKTIKDDCIIVLNDDDSELEVKKERWENIKYTYNRESDKIEDEELGSFTQYPFRLAWAITIHKSQGLTFDKAIIDAGQAFAAGQVYVALSRCTSLDGLVLYSKIWYNSVSTDARIVAFAKQAADANVLDDILEKERHQYQALQLIKIFDMSELITAIDELSRQLPSVKLSDPEDTVALYNRLKTSIKNIQDVNEKFKPVLQSLLHNTKQSGDAAALKQRLSKAVEWFAGNIAMEILGPLQEYIISLQHATRIKQYLKLLTETEYNVWQKLQRILHAQYDENFLAENILKYDHLNPALAKQKQLPEKAAKPEKGASNRESFQLFRDGKSIAEIAKLRNLAMSTVESHLAMFIRTGEIDLHELVSEEKATVIMQTLDELGEISGFSPVKEKLGDNYSYGEIRAVVNFRLMEAEKKT